MESWIFLKKSSLSQDFKIFNFFKNSLLNVLLVLKGFFQETFCPKDRLDGPGCVLLSWEVSATFSNGASSEQG